jgi:hypothetical protein
MSPERAAVAAAAMVAIAFLASLAGDLAGGPAEPSYPDGPVPAQAPLLAGSYAAASGAFPMGTRSGANARPAGVGAHPGGTAASSGSPLEVSAEALTGVVRQYCVVCHNDQLETGNLSLQHFDVAAAPEQAETAEKMIVKLRADMMPPPGMPRPGGDSLLALVETLERTIDEAAAADPDPGSRTFQRMNQREYERAIRDLLGLEIYAGTWLPSDQLSANFDNIADVQGLSPTLMDGYLNAASEIARMALGQARVPPADRIYTNSRYVSQHAWDRAEGAPYGTRGGISVLHHFPADGYYTFDLEFLSGWGERLEEQDIDVAINGERVALLHYGGNVDFQGRRDIPIRTDSVFVPAGQHRVTAAFIRTMDGPYEDLIRPHEFSLTGTEVSYGTTSLPHIREMTISGPYHSTGLSETEVRRNLMTCRPDAADQERVCAEEILSRLATRAYRRPLTDRDLSGIMRFYEKGHAEGGFDIGVRSALEAILASPHFIFRVERQPEGVEPGQSFRIADLDLASRLSFFLWGTIPDEELRTLAAEGRLSDPQVLEAQTLRMLRDPRSEALGTRFAAQWLRLQDLDKVRPDAFWFPDYSQQLADAMRRETELFFTNLVREDRSLFELYTADYSFINERLARHYGIPGVVGDEFRRVQYPEGSNRNGIFGHGSVLVLTSLGNRTSPVLRGKWVMEVLLDTPPPPPPPGVPDLEQTEGTKDGHALTTRERMEIHRASPVCSSCHVFMDPIGLALDNFDVTGKGRIREFGMPLDTRGELWNGTPVSTPGELSRALVELPTPLVRTFTLNLMAYALGRRVEYRDQPAVRAIARQAADDDYRLSAFILGVVGSDAFQKRRPAVVAQDADDRN